MLIVRCVLSSTNHNTAHYFANIFTRIWIVQGWQYLSFILQIFGGQKCDKPSYRELCFIVLPIALVWSIEINISSNKYLQPWTFSRNWFLKQTTCKVYLSSLIWGFWLFFSVFKGLSIAKIYRVIFLKNVCLITFLYNKFEITIFFRNKRKMEKINKYINLDDPVLGSDTSILIFLSVLSVLLCLLLIFCLCCWCHRTGAFNICILKICIYVYVYIFILSI